MVAQRVEFETSSSVVLQQSVVGGTFTGAEVGRASVTQGAGNAAVTFKARFLGTYANPAAEAYQVALVTPAGATQRYARFDPGANLLLIQAKAGDTANDVAALVNGDDRLPIACSPGGTGAGVAVAFAAVGLTGGLDPVVVRNHQFKFAAQTTGGLFFFDQGGNVVVRQVEAAFGGVVPWTLTLVNLDEGLTPIGAEDVLVVGATSAAFVLLDQGIVLAPLRALRLNAASTGVARVVVHREPNFPHA